MPRVLVYGLMFLAMLALSVRSCFHSDTLTVSRITEPVLVNTPFNPDAVLPEQTSARGWGLTLRFENGGSRLQWLSARQSLFSSWWVLPPPTGINSGFADGRYDAVYTVAQKWRFAGFEYAAADAQRPGIAYALRSVRVPGDLLLLTAAFGLLKVRQARRMWRIPKQGLCPNCEYDLRASTDRCPECGQPISSP
jgi:hypothetical protein